jgi:hypothetical protein
LSLFKYEHVMCVAALWGGKRTRWNRNFIPDVSRINSIYVWLECGYTFWIWRYVNVRCLCSGHGLAQ